MSPRPRQKPQPAPPEAPPPGLDKPSSPVVPILVVLAPALLLLLYGALAD